MTLIKAVVITEGIFHQFSESDAEKFKIEDIYGHSIRVGRFAANIAKSIATEYEAVDDAVTAGVLHDLGKVLLAANLPDDYGKIQKDSVNKDKPLHIAEQEMLGVSHAEVGGYFLGLWGFPHDIVEAVAFHHSPAQCVCDILGVVPAVHIANVLEQEPVDEAVSGTSLELDSEYLERLGILDQVPKWRELCSQLPSNGEDK